MWRRPAPGATGAEPTGTQAPTTTPGSGSSENNVLASGAPANEPGYVAPTGGAAPLPGAATAGPDEAQRQRSIRSLEQRLAEHQMKLAAYQANPDAFDNQGHLRNAPSPAIRQRIIDGRVRHLQGEIANFQRQIAQLKGGGSGP